ncbi:hypothetical protein SASPL_147896 [Salvia splendens]|uniref:Protein kinase domain-containing protein n=1 Tax=Salvia splendens TaxID=180675 RepID=A0A8X8WEU6_SALSN|nr:hypothetical protein SASPL_147896 [Salvia splendens]
MSYSSSRDNWERLVTAVVKREQIWQLCHQNSISTIASDYTDVTLSFSSVRSVSSSSHQLPVINDSIIEDRKNASKTISRKLFSALRWKRKPKDCDVREGLVGIPGRQPALGWPVRNSIALGVAKGLAYLHEECVRTIIHRDVKAANILLDEDFQAVLADFSLAEFMDCHDDSAIKGTLGHMAPEYLFAGKFTEKADVFSYGIFLLQLITGQYIHELHTLATKDGMQLLEMVYTVYEEKNFEVLVDSSFEGNFVKEDVEKLFQLILICTRDDPHERPTMSEVVRMIEDGECDERWKKFLWHKIFLTPGSVVLASEGWMIFDSCSLTVAEELSDPR